MIFVFGSINVDLVAEVVTIPRPGETVLTRSYATVFGGKGANQAVAAARVSPPGCVAMVGAVGRDRFGESCLENLRANGIDTSHATVTHTPTGCAFIVVDAAGENAITVASGANAEVTAASMPEAPIDETTVMVLQMEVPWRQSVAVAERVRARGGRVVWNVAPVPRDLAAKDATRLARSTDVLIVNEGEAVAFAALCNLGASTDFEFAGRAIAAISPSCIVTAGSAGAILFERNGERTAVAALAVTPVDTTGAGDTFVGVLAAQMHAGSSLGEAARRAALAASLSCLQVGAQTAMPTRDVLDRTDMSVQ